MTGSQLLFMAFGVGTQALLLAYFAARRWVPDLAARRGGFVYAVAGLGLPLGAWFLLDRQPADLIGGPLLLAAWALLGAVVDIWRPRPWRGPPMEWRVVAPYATLYLAAQMFLWWPLIRFAPIAWAVFLVLFVPSTILNLRGHFPSEAQASGPARPPSRPAPHR